MVKINDRDANVDDIDTGIDEDDKAKLPETYIKL
jgi:hypothetical protein